MCRAGVTNKEDRPSPVPTSQCALSVFGAASAAGGGCSTHCGHQNSSVRIRRSAGRARRERPALQRLQQQQEAEAVDKGAEGGARGGGGGWAVKEEEAEVAEVEAERVAVVWPRGEG